MQVEWLKEGTRTMMGVYGVPCWLIHYYSSVQRNTNSNTAVQQSATGETKKWTRERLAALNWLLETPAKLFLQDDSPSAPVVFLLEWQRNGCMFGGFTGALPVQKKPPRFLAIPVHVCCRTVCALSLCPCMRR